MDLTGRLMGDLGTSKAIIRDFALEIPEPSEYLPLVARTKEASLAEGLLKSYRFLSDGSQLYCFYGSCYKKVSESDIQNVIKYLCSVCRWRYRVAYGKEAYQIICNASAVDCTVINDYETVVPLQNGYWDYKKQELLQPSPDYLFTYCFDAVWKPELGEPELFLQFVERLVPNDDEREALLTWLAYCFVPSKRAQKALMLFGAPRSGKTVLTNIMFRIMGKDLAVEKMLFGSQDMFKNSNLRDALLCIGSELTSGRQISVQELDYFKKMVTDETIEYRMPYHAPITGKSITRFLFTANVLPRLDSSVDESFWRRWIPACTPNTIDAELADPDLLSKIMLESDKIVMFLLRRLPDIDNLLYQDWSAEMKLYFQTWGDSVARFAKDMLVTVDDMREGVEAIRAFSAYKVYCTEMKLPAVTDEWFGRRMSELGYPQTQRYSSFVGRGTRCYLGVKMVTVEVENGA